MQLAYWRGVVNMTEQKILLPYMDPEVVAREIGQFIVKELTSQRTSGAVIGLSGGVDSTTTAALAQRAFDIYNRQNVGSGKKLELIGYMLPSSTNSPEDESDGVKVAKKLGIKYEVLSIQPIVEVFKATNPEVFYGPDANFHKGNLMSRIRANILNTKAATENKRVIGTGNKDEDFGLGYYTLFGDGAVHLCPIGGLSKRLVREMACYLGFRDIAYRTPTAGLEPGQTDFKDLGYEYNFVELVAEGYSQGINPKELATHSQILNVGRTQLREYESVYGKAKFGSVDEMVCDILRRMKSAEFKAGILHPPVAEVSLYYR